MSGFHLRIKFLRNLPRWRERDERGELQSRRLTFTMQCGGRERCSTDMDANNIEKVKTALSATEL